MAVVWGLDLHDMQWYKFKSSYMFGNRDYHLRRTKFVVYQCAMIFLVISESLGTAILSDYVDQQSSLQQRFPNIDVYNDDYVGIASYNIFVGIFAAFVFGAAFFFDLFWPERYETRGIKLAWQGCAVAVCVAGLADALAYTFIVSLKQEDITGVDYTDPQLAVELASTSSKTPIFYKDSGRAIASVVFLWLGWTFAIVRYVDYMNLLVVFSMTLNSTVVMVMFYRHLDRNGSAKSQSLLARDGKESMGRNSVVGSTPTEGNLG